MSKIIDEELNRVNGGKGFIPLNNEMSERQPFPPVDIPPFPPEDVIHHPPVDIPPFPPEK